MQMKIDIENEEERIIITITNWPILSDKGNTSHLHRIVWAVIKVPSIQTIFDQLESKEIEGRILERHEEMVGL